MQEDPETEEEEARPQDAFDRRRLLTEDMLRRAEQTQKDPEVGLTRPPPPHLTEGWGAVPSERHGRSEPDCIEMLDGSFRMRTRLPDESNMHVETCNSDKCTPLDCSANRSA